MTLEQTLTPETPMELSLILRAHGPENKPFISRFPYLGPFSLISVSWNCLQSKILELDSLKKLLEKPKLRCHLNNTKLGQEAGSCVLQGSQTLVSFLLSIFSVDLTAETHHFFFFWLQEEWKMLNQNENTRSFSFYIKQMSW